MLLEQYNATKAEFKKAKRKFNKKKRKHEASIQAINTMFSITRIEKGKYDCFFKAHPKQTYTLIRMKTKEWVCYNNSSQGSYVILTGNSIDMLCISLYKKVINDESTKNEPPEC